MTPTTKPIPLVLMLYHGRLDPDQDMEEMGFDGPEIGEILSVFYCREEILLELDTDSDLPGLSVTTGWPQRRLVPIPRELFHRDSYRRGYLQMERHRDMVLSRTSTGDDTPVQAAFYGDLFLHRQDSPNRGILVEPHKPMQLRLTQGISPIAEVPDLVIEKVTAASFTYGVWTFWFATDVEAEAVRKLTGWPTGRDTCCLEMQGDPYRKVIQTVDDTVFERFLLTAVPTTTDRQ